MSDTDEDRSESEYVVERIIGKRTRRGVVEYKIKWKGYSEAESTWEPKENCDCEDIIKVYERSISNKDSTSGASSSKVKRKNTSRKRLLDSDSEEATDPSEPEEEVAPTQKSKSRGGRASASVSPDAKPVKRDSQRSSVALASSSRKAAGSTSTANNKKSNSATGVDKPKKTSVVASTKPPPPKKQAKSRAVIDSDTENSVEENSEDSDQAPAILSESDLDKGLEPETILGCTNQPGELMFLIKWKNQNRADLVSSKIAKIACPQTVISYFEDKLTWNCVEPSSTM